MKLIVENCLHDLFILILWNLPKPNLLHIFILNLYLLKLKPKSFFIQVNLMNCTLGIFAYQWSLS